MLNGQSITLGPILPVDFPFLFNWADDLEASRLNEPYRPPVWKSQQEFWSNVGNDATRVYFAIRLRNEAPIIGYVQIWSIDPVHRSAILGIRIGSEIHRSRGYGSDALRLAIDYCWNHLNLSRISLLAFSNNERAIRLYGRFGFEHEGRLRKAVFIDGHWLDLITMGLLHPSRQDPTSAA
jgi:RimJ/RimL family protein N-acetyltransferase